MSTIINSETNNATNSVCPICGGLGLVTYNVPIDHPDFGKAFPCRCQAKAVKMRQLDRLRTLANLEAYAHLTFSTFEIPHDQFTSSDDGFDCRHYCPPLTKTRDLQPEHWSQVKAALEMALRYAMEPQGWFLMWGSYGTGKTHLAVAIANWQIELGTPVLFMTAPDLLDHLKATFSPTTEITTDDLFSQMRDAPLLVLDDLGAEKSSEWAQEKLYQLLNHRHVRALPTVITTNTPLELLEPRIRSRLTDQQLTRSIRLAIPDRRGASGTSWREHDLTNLDRYRGMHFASLSLRTEEELPEKQGIWWKNTVQAIQSYATKPDGWLVVIGEPGCGKTHLAAAIAHERKARGEKTLFVTTSELIDYLRATFYPSARVSFDKRLEEIKRADLVIFDDLVITDDLSSWVREKLYDVLIYRFDYRLATVITTAQTLDKIDARLRSRIKNEAVCNIAAIPLPAYTGKVKRATPPRR